MGNLARSCFKIKIFRKGWGYSSVGRPWVQSPIQQKHTSHEVKGNKWKEEDGWVDGVHWEAQPVIINRVVERCLKRWHLSEKWGERELCSAPRRGTDGAKALKRGPSDQRAWEMRSEKQLSWAQRALWANRVASAFMLRQNWGARNRGSPESRM